MLTAGCARFLRVDPAPPRRPEALRIGGLDEHHRRQSLSQWQAGRPGLRSISLSAVRPIAPNSSGSDCSSRTKRSCVNSRRITTCIRWRSRTRSSHTSCQSSTSMATSCSWWCAQPSRGRPNLLWRDLGLRWRYLHHQRSPRIGARAFRAPSAARIVSRAAPARRRLRASRYSRLHCRRLPADRRSDRGGSARD